VKEAVMKKFFGDINNKLKNIAEEDLATKDRPVNFQLIVILLLLSTVFFLSFCVIQILFY